MAQYSTPDLKLSLLLVWTTDSVAWIPVFKARRCFIIISKGSH